ncbi:hypothetical protein CDL15_Pgr027079 [Punica granatum]|uniref:Uncharacterized protein n=1 Tax=Punica granatum TaxID=22663 RepID=A0A218XHQ7_PUNGR|nr:hypothetical protein CDL15_Pgr027079 [Punica granatum]
MGVQSMATAEDRVSRGELQVGLREDHGEAHDGIESGRLFAEQVSTVAGRKRKKKKKESEKEEGWRVVGEEGRKGCLVHNPVTRAGAKQKEQS